MEQNFNSKISSFTPKEIVDQLDRFIIGQNKAKRAVAIALRNRYRRMQIKEPMQSEIMPKNILMIGSTGVGKTEIARRLAKLAQAPFIKIEATKFTEVGYVGRDVESIIRDLVNISIDMFTKKAKEKIKDKAKDRALDRILNSVVGKDASLETRSRFKGKILNHELDNTEIEIDILPSSTSKSSGDIEIPGMPGASIGMVNISDILGKSFGGDKKINKKLTLKKALEIITNEEENAMIDSDQINQNALQAVENDAIVFLDEIDKIASRSSNNGSRGEVSREGVQRDLLPLIEGTTVATKYGNVKTDHILFIASGAFHTAKPSDLLPELQGRLPIRVEMSSLTKSEFIKILTEPEFSLIKQYSELLATENISLDFTNDGIEEIANLAENFNQEIEDIGARRLHTIIENILEEISFEANHKEAKKVIIDKKFVNDKLNNASQNIDLAKFIL